MRIAFFDSSGLVYNVDSPLQEPLGGTESAICYLAKELRKVCQVEVCIQGKSEINNFDVVVVNSNPALGPILRQAGFKGILILWHGQDVDQGCLRPLLDKGVVDSFDWVTLWSGWHKSQHDVHFPLCRVKSSFIRSGSGIPWGVDLVKEPVCVYCSTPYRGLDKLVEAWPLVKKEVPWARLEVYSGMNLYGRPETGFEGLYSRVRELEGATYSACVSQTELATVLSRACVLSYPCTFRETFCVSLADAMCSGVYPVIGDVGALRETSLGFGSLVRLGPGFVERWASEVVRVLESIAAGELSEEIEGMVKVARSHYDWGGIAGEWMCLFERLLRGKVC